MYISRKILNLLLKCKLNYKILNKDLIITSRSSNIPKLFKNKKFFLLKGLYFNKIKVTSFNRHYKFGEFSFTKRIYVKNFKKS